MGLLGKSQGIRRPASQQRKTPASTRFSSVTRRQVPSSDLQGDGSVAVSVVIDISCGRGSRLGRGCFLSRRVGRGRLLLRLLLREAFLIDCRCIGGRRPDAADG